MMAATERAVAAARVARRAVGQQLGVALVQARDGVAEVIVREVLEAPASARRHRPRSDDALVAPTDRRRTSSPVAPLDDPTSETARACRRASPAARAAIVEVLAPRTSAASGERCGAGRTSRRWRGVRPRSHRPEGRASASTLRAAIAASNRRCWRSPRSRARGADGRMPARRAPSRGRAAGRGAAVAARPLGEQRRTLRLPELDRARSSASASAPLPAARSAAASARRASAWSRSASVAAAIATAARANAIAAPCSPRRASASARTPRQAIAALQIVAGEQLALVAQRLGLGGAALREQRAAEQRRRLRRVDAEPVIAEPVVRRAARARRRRRRLRAARCSPANDLGFEQPLRDAELLDHRARRRDHAARRLGAAAQRFQHRLAARARRPRPPARPA